MNATVAPMPMPTLAPVLSGGVSEPGTMGIGAALEVGRALGDAVASLVAGVDDEPVEFGRELAVPVAALLAEDDAGRVVVAGTGVDDEDGVYI